MIPEIVKVEPTDEEKNERDQIKWVLIGTRLIIGPFQSHLVLVMDALYPDLKVRDFATARKKLDEYAQNGGDEFLAAGTAWSGGEMTYWKSYQLGLKTPHHLRGILYPVIRDTILHEPKWRQE